MKPPRVAIVGFLQETNTFVPGLTRWEDFESGILLRGEALREVYGQGNHEISGFFAGLAAEGVEAVPILFAFALPGPRLVAEVPRRLWAEIEERLLQAGPLEGCLVALGGAAVSEECDDLEGWLLGRLRAVLGTRRPLIATLDPHCHVSRQMVETTQALLAYRTNPHLDQKERGEKAARLMARAVRGEISPRNHFCRLPMVINMESQATSRPPLSHLREACLAAEAAPEILDASLVLGFPYGDVPEIGSGVCVVSDEAGPQGDRAACELAAQLWHERRALAGSLLSPEVAVDLALSAPGPVLLLDMGDNIGGGARGDGTWLARLLLARPEARSFVCLHSPEAVAACRRARVGESLPLRAGGWSAPTLQGEPLEFEAVVESFPPPRFREETPRHGGWLEFTLGPACCVRSRSGNLVCLLTSRAVPPFSPGLLTAAGVRGEAFDIIVAKGVHGPLGAFGALCPTAVWANTPGVTCADLSRFPYARRPRPMEPFEPFEVSVHPEFAALLQRTLS